MKHKVENEREKRTSKWKKKWERSSDDNENDEKRMKRPRRRQSTMTKRQCGKTSIQCQRHISTKSKSWTILFFSLRFYFISFYILCAHILHAIATPYFDVGSTKWMDWDTKTENIERRTVKWDRMNKRKNQTNECEMCSCIVIYHEAYNARFRMTAKKKKLQRNRIPRDLLLENDCQKHENDLARNRNRQNELTYFTHIVHTHIQYP